MRALFISFRPKICFPDVASRRGGKEHRGKSAPQFKCVLRKELFAKFVEPEAAVLICVLNTSRACIIKRTYSP